MNRFKANHNHKSHAALNSHHAELPSRPDFQVLEDYPIKVALGEILPIVMGSFAVVEVPKDPSQKKIPRYMASGGFLDCVGIIGCIQDNAGRPNKWLLSHLTSRLDPKRSISAIVNALRSPNSKMPIEFDLIGGSFHSIKFFEKLLFELEETRNIKIRNNHILDDRFRDEIVIDLHKGWIFARTSFFTYELDAISYLFSLTAKNDPGPCRDDFRYFHKTPFGLMPHNNLRTPVQFDWQACMDQAKANFSRFKKELTKQFRKDNFDPNWEFESDFGSY